MPRINKRRVSGGKYYPLFEHGLGCTEGLVRFYRSDMDCQVIPERKLRGFGIVPEAGILYPNNTLLLYEFCTHDNFNRPGLILSKITRYQSQLSRFEQKFGGEAVVVFVADDTRFKVDCFVNDHMPLGEQLFFTDYKTFLDTPIGEQLCAPIYIWGNDSWPYALRGSNDS
ncbi:hypothetical protein ACFLZW_04250 [Chloroflexota bacterium]